jgi:5'-nucleotidase
MRVLIDLDGVLADWEAGFLAAFQAAHPGEAFVPLAERRTFHAIEQYPERLRAACRQLILAPGFYRNLAPIAGGKEALAAMEAAGLEVFLCSSPLGDYRNCVLEKYAWVDEHLGRSFVERLVLTRDKTLVTGDVLVDDRPSVTGAAAPTWEHVLYDQPYNRAVPDRRRLTWAGWRPVLLGRPPRSGYSEE